MRVSNELNAKALLSKAEAVFEHSAKKIRRIQKEWDPSKGTPVFTKEGKYTSRGWTEWTQGFQYGSEILQFDATGESEFLEAGRKNTLERMAPHLTHTGVHDHGFNNISTYGNLRRLMNEGRVPENKWERHFYELAVKVSGAVQAARWTPTANGFGYVYSFNGPHSLFVDTIRSLRAVGMSHRLGHVLMGENDKPVSLLERLAHHGRNTARFNVYHGAGRDQYDIRGRTLHEAVFNSQTGVFRCPGTQQGYSPFSTWTRGLAWAITGFAEQLEFLNTLPGGAFETVGGKNEVMTEFLEAARSTADFYIENTPTDGIPYWDTGAPGLARMDGWTERPSDPFNDFEPVDSSAAAIAGQGLLRLGNYLQAKNPSADAGKQYRQAALTVADNLFADPYLSDDENHHGLILHSVYHRPNAWDHVPAGSKIPRGESSMWGDYHAREFALMLIREAKDLPYYTFFG